MPISQELLQILCCPRSRVPVIMLSAGQVARLNAAVNAGELKYADGSVVKEPLQEALVTTDGRTVYRIDDSIPVMLVDQAIHTDQLADWTAHAPNG